MSAVHDLAEYSAIFGAGIAAGVMNTVVGSGTLLTFPTLLAFGYNPVLANVSNTIGLVPGAVSGAYGYRAEMAGQRRRGLTAAGASVLRCPAESSGRSCCCTCRPRRSTTWCRC